MKCITELSQTELAGKYVLVRAGLDLPLDDKGNVSDLYRVARAAATLLFLSRAGARTIILSHIGRDPKITNEAVARALQKYIGVFYVPDLLGIVAHDACRAMKDGEVLMLENLRSDPREEQNDENFAKEIATLGDMYVDDAFSAAHRAHASMVGVPKFLPHYAGILFAEEVTRLSVARTPTSPSLAILGGAKFETKEPLVKLLLEKYDHLLIAGALANDVFKAQGLPTGVSLISQSLPDQSILQHPHFLAPVDVTVERADGQAYVKKPADVLPDDRIVDIGPDTLAMLSPYIAQAKHILWNGPTGLYEHGFAHWTGALAQLISKSGAFSTIGGGDTIAAIQKSDTHVGENVFLSTGGGAMLDYLLYGTLPAIEALE